MVALLGGTPIALPAYDSYGMIEPKADEKAILSPLKAASEPSRSSWARVTLKWT